MTIGSLSVLPNVSLPTNQGTTGNRMSASASSSGTVGDQLLAQLAQSQASSGAAADPLLQDLVALSPAALGQASSSPLTYNAQGLLQQIQSSMMPNDPQLQSDATDTGSATGNSLLQSLMASSQGSTTAALSSASAGGATAFGNAASDVNATLAQLVQKDPALANAVLESQMEQDAIASMLG